MVISGIIRILLLTQKQNKMATEKQFAQHFEHKDYYATTDGEILSFKGKQPRFIIQCKHGRGYTQFIVCNGKGKVKSYLTHRFVYECFYGEIPEGMQIHHIDHDKQNNVLDNLQMVTDAENKMHAKKAGRKTGRHLGSKNKNK